MLTAIRRAPRASALVVALATGALLLSSTSGGSAAAPSGHKVRGHQPAAKTLPLVTTSFTGANTGTIPDATGGLCGNTTTPGTRDVTFTVSGLTTPISVISVAFSLTHSFIGDVSATLIAPDGTTTGSVFNRVGATSPGSLTGNVDTCGYSARYGAAYTFNNTGSANPWTAIGSPPPTSTLLPAGTYRTTGPLSSATTNLVTTFGPLATAGINGTWKLRFSDTGVGDTGTVSAVSLSLTTPNPVPCQQATAKLAAAKAALGAADKKASSAATRLKKARAMLKSAKRSGNPVKIRKAKKRVKRANKKKKAAHAAVVTARAAVASAQAGQAAVC